MGRNGYVKEIIFKDTQAPTTFDNFDAITNKSLFSKVWWAKYFGLYSCQNKLGVVEKMYFGCNDIIMHKPESRDDVSCALDILDTTLCAKNGLFAKNGDFSLQSLLVMIKRLKNHEVDSDKEVIECHAFARLVLIGFITTLIGIVHPDNVFEWHYNYKDKKLKRDDFHWKQLF